VALQSAVGGTAIVHARVFGAWILIMVAGSSIAQQHQHAAVGEKLGQVHLTTSCNAAAQQQFDRALALLHSFQFSHAIEGFNATLKADSSCAMAYWGIALSHWGNPFATGLKATSQLEDGRQAAEHGLAIGAKTEREGAYVAAVSKLYTDFEKTSQQVRLLAYRDAMAETAAHYPQDYEASIFYALALAASEEPTDKTYASRLKAGAILEALFAQQPEHPGLAHYIIHAYDVPPLASRALLAAQRYSRIAPDAPHALHMPSHTFTRVGYWQDSIDSNLAASAAARREGQTAEELHALDYQAYAYLQTAQDEAARRLVESLPEILSRFDSRIVSSGAAPPLAGYFALGAIPARYALERRDWKAAAQLEVRETPFPYTEAMTYFARGLAAAHLGDIASARTSREALTRIHGRLAKSHEGYWAEQVEIQRRGVSAWTALAEGRKDEALREMKSAAELEDSTEKSAVTPGPLAPSRELLGEMLLQMNRPKEALEEFEATLKREPNRFRALYGEAHAAQLKGDREAMQRYFREVLKVCEHADRPGRKELAEALEVVGS
jgi:tetratricopeptide (TPR) repeat protein